MSTSTRTAVRGVTVLVAAAGLALGLAACSGSSSGGKGPASSPPASSSSTGSATGPATSSATVVVKDFSFTPSTVTVTKGGKVTWKFEDDVNHNVDIASLKKKSPDLMGGKSYTTTFNTPGTYSYICTIHQYMNGKVVVK